MIYEKAFFRLFSLIFKKWVVLFPINHYFRIFAFRLKSER